MTATGETMTNMAPNSQNIKHKHRPHKVKKHYMWKKPSPVSIGFLTIWHGLFSGGFFAAMLTGNHFYHAHVFAGVLVIVAIAARLLVGTIMPSGHVLMFPFPSFRSLMQGTNGFRRFVSHSMGLSVLIACGVVSLTGWFATEQNLSVHAALSYLSLSLIGGHVVLVIVWQGWKKVESKFSARP